MATTGNGGARVVYEFSKGRLESIRASISEYRGKQYADLRTYYEVESDSPDLERAPTKKGISIRLDLLPELKNAVAALIEAAAAERA